MDADFDRDALIQAFLIESEENISAIEESLVILESDPLNNELLQTIFRAAHTIKGNALSLDFPVLAEFSHIFEELLDRLRERIIPVTKEIITLLLNAASALRDMVPCAAANREQMAPSQLALVKQLQAASAQTIGGAQEDIAAAPMEQAETYRPQPPVYPHNITAPARTLRVNIDKLDRMLNLTGEIAIARGKLRDALERLKAEIGEEALEAYFESERLSMELQEQVMKLRMVAVGPTFRQYIKTVRNIANAYGKQARLVIEGADVEVDTRVIEHLKDPLTHMLRNAIDHGIEPPALRVRAGKDACGVITLRAYHAAGAIVIQIIDDGAGFQREKIVAQARRRNIAGDFERLTEAEIYQLVFEPGFSTAETVTALSGRGVGMDVVRRNIEALRGSIRIDSRAGAGSTLTVRLPLTLAIIDGFAIGIDRETYIIPLESVIECLARPDGAQEKDGTGVINLRGQALPCLRLKEALEVRSDARGRENIVVVQYEGGRVGIVVDELYGDCQVVVKPLGRLFQHLPGIIGSTILGNGRVALILDVTTILKNLVTQNASLLV